MSTAASFNATIISKLSWMSRQLRKIDDVSALVNWVNTMHSVKALLFPLSSGLYCHGTPNHETSQIASPTSLPSLYSSPTADPLPSAADHVPHKRPQLINYPQTQQQSTSNKLCWSPPFNELPEALQLSPSMNVSIPPSVQISF